MATPNPATVGASVTFNASASYDPDGTITSYAWDFGDSRTGTGRITTHPYASVGTFNVSLTVTDNDNFNATTRRDVVVQTPPPGPQAPVADFVAGPSPTNPGSPVTFNASASYDTDGFIVSYAWDFGDSAIDNQVIATHSYLSPGVYTVRLTVVDNQTLSSSAIHQVSVNAPPLAVIQYMPTTIFIGMNVTFDGSASSDPEGPIVSYTWNFGDNSTGTGLQPRHAYAAKGAFTVTLTVVDNLLLSNRTTSSILVGNRAPRIIVSNPDLGPVTVGAGTTQNFAVEGFDPDHDLMDYTWRIDDVVTGENDYAVNFSSTAPGSHIVNVTVSDGSLAAWREWNVTVVANPPSLVESAWPFAAIALIILAIVLVVWRRRRPRKPEGSPPPPPP